MIYIVSGYMRSGTSMMMDCLRAGGIEPAFEPSRDDMNSQFGDDDYRPNPNGFYELSRKEFNQPGFPRMYDGKLVKILAGGLQTKMAVHGPGYRVVFMRRDPEEIRQSYEAFFCSNGRKLPAHVDQFLANYEENIGEAIALLENRKDVKSIAVAEYRTVVEKPQLCFADLKLYGWPIDYQKAAAAVEPHLCRFRREHLVEGA